MTYREIQDYIKSNHNKTVKTCWIAHAKEIYNLPLKSSSRSKNNQPRTYPCPDWALPLIKDAFQYFNLL